MRSSPCTDQIPRSLQNVYRLGQTLYSGSSPRDEAAFSTLSRLGIKTIISVEGAEPDIDTARAHGMRYVHLPIVYAGLTHERLVELVRAANEYPTPIYIYCDRGVDRAPIAAAALWMCLNRQATKEQAIAVAHKISGDANPHPRLLGSLLDATRPTEEEWKASNSALPEVSQLPPFTRSMASIGRMWDRVAIPVKDRHSTTISLQLDTAYDIAEQFRESAAMPGVPDELRPGLQAIVGDAEKLAEIIKSELRDPTAQVTGRQQAVDTINNRCHECHTKFRD